MGSLGVILSHWVTLIQWLFRSSGTMLRLILRAFSYVYHFPLCLFLIAVGAIALLSPNANLTLDMLPWEDPELRYWLFFGGLAGLLSLILAATGKVRLLFLVWTVVVLILMVRGFFLSRYSFQDAGHFYNALLLVVGALLAMVGAATRVRARI
jgi:hypothetical protein